MVLLAGAGALAAGFVLRTGTANEQEPADWVLPTPANTGPELTFLAMPLERCEACGAPLPSMGFRIMRDGRSYDSVACARAQGSSGRP
jgi:hypothetical protein